MESLIVSPNATLACGGSEPGDTMPRESAQSALRTRVAMLTNEIPPYRVPAFEELSSTPNWDFKVFTCIDREAGRLWNVQQEFSFPTRRCFSLSYIRRIRHGGAENFDDTRQIHLPLGLIWDLWRFRPDVVISAELGARTLIASLYTYLRKRHLIVWFEGTSHTERDLTRSQRWLRRLMRRAPHSYIVNGKQGREYVEGLGVNPETIFEVGQPIDTEPFQVRQSAAERTALRKEFGLHGHCYLCCGSLCARKGCDQLLDAWELFSRQMPVDATLVMLGDGPDRAHLESRVAKAGLHNVRFLGHLQRERLPAIYQAADVLVLPTLEDCWALVVSEAMASGLPVINSKYAGSADLVVEGETGWIIDPFNIEEVAQKLALAWSARDRQPAMSEAARQAVASMSIATVAQRVRQIVARLPLKAGGEPGLRIRNTTRVNDSSQAWAARREECVEMITTDLKPPVVSPTVPSHVEELRPSLGVLLKNCGMRLAGRGAVCLNSVLGSRAGASLGIVTYHRVAPHVRGLRAPLCNVTPQRFREQLETLLRAGFTFLPLTEVLDLRSRGKTPPPRSLVLTFDDGFASVYYHAWPVMRELGIPSTIFVTTGFLNQDTPFPFDAWGVAYEGLAPPETYRPLTIEECREMLDGGLVDIGAHTHTHADFRNRPEAFRQEVQRSLDFVREHFQRSVVTFAYPFGSPRLGFAGDDLVAAARQTDAACALTTDSVLVDTSTDPYSWGRFNAFSWDSGCTLAAKLSGWYGWAAQAYRRCVQGVPRTAASSASPSRPNVAAEFADR